MNNKDLFNGLNHIDDEIINEAMEPCALNGVVGNSEDVEAGREKMMDIKKKRIEIRKLKRVGLDKKFISMFMKLMEYASQI